eukprot:358772-Chlamydomonas_euryale.AAC.2
MRVARRREKEPAEQGERGAGGWLAADMQACQAHFAVAQLSPHHVLQDGNSRAALKIATSLPSSCPHLFVHSMWRPADASCHTYAHAQAREQARPAETAAPATEVIQEEYTRMLVETMEKKKRMSMRLLGQASCLVEERYADGA